MEKKCTKCGEVKPLDLFYAHKSTKDGRGSQCKECVRESARKWKLENPEKARESFRKWRLENLEKRRESFRKWYLKNSEKTKERARKWQLENPEKARGYDRKWVDRLSDGYVTKLIKQSGLPPEIIEDNPELIELKRLQIQLNRKINQKKKEL